MIYLILAVACTSAINLGFAVAKRRELDNLNVSVYNYIAGSITAALLLAMQGTVIPGFSLGEAIGGLGTELSATAGFTFSVVFGAATGLAYLAALVLAQRSIAKSGVSLTSMFQRLGVVLPILLSALLWAEVPTLVQWGGIALAAAAVAWLNGGGIKLNGTLIAVLLLTGVVEFTNKLYQTVAGETYKPVYLLCIFVSSLLLCLIYRWRQGSGKPRVGEAVLGLAVGVPNVLAANFTIKALSVLPGSIVFPVISGGTILLVTLVSLIAFGDQISKRVWTAIGMIILSMILVNL